MWNDVLTVLRCPGMVKYTLDVLQIKFPGKRLKISQLR